LAARIRNLPKIACKLEVVKKESKIWNLIARSIAGHCGV